MSPRTKRQTTPNKQSAANDRMRSILALVAYMQFVMRQVILDPYIQAAILSAYVCKQPQQVIAEPFLVFQSFMTAVKVLLPDVHPWRTDRYCLYNTRGAYRRWCLQALGARRGTPTQLTLLLAALYTALDVPVRLCTAWGDDEPLEFAYELRKALLSAQLAKPGPESISRARRPLSWPRARHPVLWLEIHWPEVDAWVALELYTGRFNIAHTLQGTLPSKGRHLKASEVQPDYLRAHVAKVVQRLEVRHLQMEVCGSPLKKPTGVALESMFDSFGGEDNDDEAYYSEDEEAMVRESVVEIPEMTISGPHCSAWQTELESIALMESMAVSAADRVEFKPFSFFMPPPQPATRASAKDALPQPRCRLLKLVRAALACDADGQIRDVTYRYLPVALTNRHKGVRTAVQYVAKVLHPNVSRTRWHTLDAVDELTLARSRVTKEMPKSLSAFKDHDVYALESSLKSREVLVADRGDPVGFFRGEPVWLRVHVKTLRTVQEWERKGRTVIDITNPVKNLEQRTRQKEIKHIGLYSDDQTQMMSEEEYQRRLTNSPGYFVVKQGFVPAGWVLLKDSVFPGVLRAARQAEVAHKVAIVGFQYTRGDLKPIKDGIICEEEGQERVLDRQKVIEAADLRHAAFEQRKRAVGWWRVLFKMIIATAE